MADTFMPGGIADLHMPILLIDPPVTLQCSLVSRQLPFVEDGRDACCTISTANSLA